MLTFVSRFRIPLLVLAIAIAVIALLLAFRNRGPEKVRAGAWVTDICGLVAQFEERRDALVEEASAVDAGDLNSARNEFSGYLEELDVLRMEFRDDVESAGQPDVDGGGDVREALLQRFEAAGEIVAEMRAQAVNVDTSSPQAFQASVRAILTTSGDLPDLRANLQEIATENPESQRVIDLIDQDSECAEFLFDTNP